MSLAAGRSRSHIREATTSVHTDQPGRQQSERGWIIWRTRGTISMKRRSRAAHGDGPCKEWTQLQPGVGAARSSSNSLAYHSPSELRLWTAATPHTLLPGPMAAPPFSAFVHLAWEPAFCSLGWIVSSGPRHGPPLPKGPS